MARVLFSALPAYGHIVQLVAIARELARRGHEVAWALDPGMHHRVGPDEARRYPTRTAFAPVTDPRERRRSTRSRAIRDFFGSTVPGLALSMIEGIEAAVDDFEPDVLVTELGCYAASIVARRRGLPWLVVSSTVVLYNELYTQLPGIGDWVQRGVTDAQRQAGVEPLPWPLRSPWGNLVTGPPGVAGLDPDIRPTDHLVGAVLPPDPVPVTEEVLAFLARHEVTFAVSYGTVSPHDDTRWLRGLLQTLGSRPNLGVVISSKLDFGTLPPAVMQRPWFPFSMGTLMPHVDAFVSHGGLNSVTEALFHGTPMLLRPLAYDQHPITAALERMGVGIALTHRVGVEHAVERILEPVYAERARVCQQELRRMGGTSEAAVRVLATVGAPCPSP